MTIERLVVARGAAFALVIASPAALANTWLAAQVPKPTGTLNMTFLLMVAGFVVGGTVAGREASAGPTAHGALAGLLAFVPVQAIGLLGRTGREDPVSLAAIFFLMAVSAAAGALGATASARTSSRRGT